MLDTHDSLHDTIVAPATASGGAVAILRLSGPEARRIGQALAPRRDAGLSHRLVRAAVRGADDAVLDDALVVEMHGPRSYTGEDVVEVHLHGGVAVTEAVLGRVLRLGARHAQPGEFTLRAFLNGRMDLAQAEAVADLVGARNEAARAAAVTQLAGGVSRRVEGVIETLEGVLSAWRAVLDFPEYPTGDAPTAAQAETLRETLAVVRRLADTARVDVDRGFRVALTGAPNVGKSTLLNAWAGHERVLVDDAPGTTRDPVDLQVGSGAHAWWVCDTAGIRDAADGLEGRGVRLSLERAGAADLVLWLVAVDAPTWPTVAWPRLMLVGSRADLGDRAGRDALAAAAGERGHRIEAWVSGKTGEGVDDLRHVVARRMLQEAPGTGQTVVVRRRHVEALRACEDALAAVLHGLENRATLDILGLDLEEAARRLGTILGRDVDGAVLDRIFADFCIGK
jgi:tRNA modification GTPase